MHLEDQESSLVDQFSSLESEKNQLKQKYEEKLIEIDRNFISRERHDEIIREKNKHLDEIKEELMKKELEFNKEFNTKLRVSEERKAKEYEAMIITYRNNIKDLEGNNEETKRKVKSLDKELSENKENLRNLESFKRSFEGKMAEKTMENDRLLKEKEEILRNLKGMERGFEEKTMIIKRLERNNSDFLEELKVLKEKVNLVNKEKI